MKNELNPILQKFADNGFPSNLTYQLPNGTWTNRVDYVLANYNMPSFSLKGRSPFNLSMFDVLQRLYSTGNYGVLAEEYGYILLERNYTGPIVYYHPINEFFQPSSFLVLNNSYYHGNVITGTNVSGHRIWYGPYTFLSPGQYTATFHLMTNNNSISNSIDLWMVDYVDGQTFRELTITGASFAKTNTLTNISVNFSVNNFYNEVEFASHAAYWNGTLSLYGVSCLQISNRY
jgi:hypothetical protein